MERHQNEQPDQQLHITGEYIAGQFKQLAPQLHLTLASVLQGLALGALALNIGKPTSFKPNDILVAIFQHDFYLPQIASFLIIVTAWNAYMYAVICLPWPLSPGNTLLQFLLALPEFAAFSAVNEVGAWMIWVGVLALLSEYYRIRNRYVISKELYRQPDERQAEPVLWRKFVAPPNPYGSLHYWLFGPIFIVIGFLRETGLVPGVSAPFVVGSHAIVYVDVILPTIAIVVLILNVTVDGFFFAQQVNATFRAYNIPYHLRGISNALETGLPHIEATDELERASEPSDQVNDNLQAAAVERSSVSPRSTRDT